MGKIHGVPCHKLWGGPVRDYIRLYCHLGGGKMEDFYETSPEDADRFGELAAAAVDEGFTAFKSMAVPETMPIEGRLPVKYAEANVKAMRDAVGDAIDIMVDCYMGWSLEYAREMLRRLAPYRLRWVEEPLTADDIAGYADLRAMGIVPIAGGEHEYSPYGFRQLIDARAIDFAQFDVNRVGGITAAHKIVHLCEAFDVAVMPHAGQMHNYHISMSTVAAPFAEYFPIVPVEVGNELFWYIFDGEPEAENGFINLRDDVPGFGLTLKSPDLENFRLIT